MSANPTSVAISDLLAIKPRNGLYKSKEHHGSGHRWIKMSEVYGNDFLTGQETERLEVTPTEINKFGCLEGDLLFGRTSLTLEGVGDCLLVGDVNDQPIFESNLFRIRLDRSKALPLFYFYFFKSKAGKLLIQTIAKQTAATSITSTDFINLRVPYPKLDIQRKIAVQIHSFDKKICLNNQINQTLEQMAQAIFKSWFVDFEPVKAKIATLEAGGSEQDALLAAMQAISGKDEAALTRLKADYPEQYAELQTTAALFPSAMQDSELGEIPEGWEVQPLSNMVNLLGGGTPKKSEPSYWGGNICWFSVKDAPSEGNVFVIDTEDKITDAGLKGSSTKLLPIGTTIITARGTVGKLALTGVVTAMNQSCYGVLGNDGTGPYLNYLRLSNAVNTLKRNTHGAVFDTITRTTFETVVQPQASLELRQKFEEVVEPMFKNIRTSLQQTQTLSSLRDTLLPKLLSGELSLEDIETGEVATA